MRNDQEIIIREQLIPRGICDTGVLEAIQEVPRIEFMSSEHKESALFDGAFSIGFGQTISQPYMVAKMIELLKLTGKEKILEVGTGSGYQAAVLSKLAKKVYTIERIDGLIDFANKNLEAAGLQNVEVILGDGTKGLKKHAPYDGIIVVAYSEEIPDSLKEQLAEGGRLVIPIGGSFVQQVVVLEKQKDEFKENYYDSCVFVPLVAD
jgi:protein-L-isoaspartate(D-aspartate) O-methyltransferase